ncbi:MAG: hypothetical protein CM15mV102_330 [uncultured marine virus]|nr:MAG: hypothetical protein CM15mV102_330 [uncultured marine virus]
MRSTFGITERTNYSITYQMNEDDIVKDDLEEEGLGDIIRERDKKLKEDLDGK